MSIQVNVSSGVTGEGLRATTMSHNSAYTVLFNFYHAGGSFSDVFVWGISGSTTSDGGAYLGTRADRILGSGAGNWKLTVNVSGNEDFIAGSGPSAAGWYNVSVRRASATSLILRVNGSDLVTATTDVSSREAAAYEVFGMDEYSGGRTPINSRFTNYKAWTAALSTSEIDAEHDTTTFIVTSNKYSGSPMGDASTLAGNNTADGSGAAWTLGAGLIAGANDPGVTYAGGNNDLAGSATAGATAGATITVQRNLAAAAVAGALASGTLSVNKPLSGAAIGAALGSATLTAFSSVWRIPTNAPNGTAVHATVFSGASPTYAILAQGTAVVAGGFVDIPGIGSIGAKAFAFVHNYADNTATSSIRGGPAIATLTSL
jgi:hypothetical protein